MKDLNEGDVIEVHLRGTVRETGSLKYLETTSGQNVALVLTNGERGPYAVGADYDIIKRADKFKGARVIKYVATSDGKEHTGYFQRYGDNAWIGWSGKIYYDHEITAWRVVE